MDAGDLATWVGSSFAAVAAGATLWTLLSQQRQIREQREFIGEQSMNLGLERAELQAQAVERHSAQARRVRMRINALGEGDVFGPVNRWSVVITNSSDAPIRDVSVWFGDSFEAVWGQVSEAFLTIDHERLRPPIAVLACGYHLEFESPRLEHDVVKQNRPVLHFTDKAGTRWLLDEFGHLDEQESGSSQNA